MAEIAAPFTEYVLQTLVSESWRRFETYDLEDDAQDIARQLVEDWGAARVRILGGYFSNEKNRKVYHLVDITEAPETGVLQILAAANAGLSTSLLSSKASSRKIIGGSALSGAVLAGCLILFAALPPFTSHAVVSPKPAGIDTFTEAPEISDGPLMDMAEEIEPSDPVTTRTPAIAEIATPPEPVDLQAKFLEIASVPYGRVRGFDAAPIRLRGPWSTACWKKPEMLVIREHKLHQTAARQGQDISLKDTPQKDTLKTARAAKTAPKKDITAFSTVWQSGQRYGIHLEDGTVYILDLVSFDQIKPLGIISGSGDFTAETQDNVLNRCI